MPSKTKKTKAKAPEADYRNFVTHDDLSSFKDQIIDAVKEMVSVPKADEVEAKPVITVETQTEQPKEEKKVLREFGSFDNAKIPDNYKKIFDKFFDEDDGFTARMNFGDMDEKTGEESGGITFTIFVPMKFSNTDDGYRKLYKVDLRTRALQPHNIAKGIEEWCKAVARNLKYNKLMRTK